MNTQEESLFETFDESIEYRQPSQPTIAKRGSVGFDVYCDSQNVIICKSSDKGVRLILRTNIKVNWNYAKKLFGQDVFFRIEARSGVARDEGVVVLGGVIDTFYEGEIIVNVALLQEFDAFQNKIQNLLAKPIIQLVPYPNIPLQFNVKPRLADERGTGGFGSTDDVIASSPTCGWNTGEDSECESCQ